MSVAPRPTVADALRLARTRFLSPERIDMSALADELGVNRVTLRPPPWVYMQHIGKTLQGGDECAEPTSRRSASWRARLSPPAED
ncbi:MAG: hypothetical protein ABSH51_23440 [Solirubrobacteraceae bacterium]